MQVVPPDEVGVGFDDIGALEAVKDTLREVRPGSAKQNILFSKAKYIWTDTLNESQLPGVP